MGKGRDAVEALRGINPDGTITSKTLDDITNYIGANHIHYPVRNESGATIPKGTVVTGSSTQPGTDYIQVVPRILATQVALGITHTELANNSVGLAINTGVCVDMIDTSSWDEGTILYPDTAGGLTDTKPTSGSYQACAVVTRSHATQGTLLVEFTEPSYLASTTLAGYVQLNDTLTSTSTTQALTANQGKILQDSKGGKATANTWTAPQAGTITTDNDLSFDLAVTNNFKCTPTATGQIAFTNLLSGRAGTIILDNSTPYTLTAAANVKVDSNFLTTINAGGVFWLSYITDGTSVYVTTSEALA